MQRSNFLEESGLFGKGEWLEAKVGKVNEIH